MSARKRLALATLGAAFMIATGQAYSIDLELSEHLDDAVTATFEDVFSKPTVFTLENPKRIVVDIENHENLSVSGVEESSIVETVRYGIAHGDQLRVVLDISGQYNVASVEHWEEGSQIVVYIRAHIQRDCTPNAVDLNVCDLARELSLAAATQLPMKISNDLSLDKVISSGNTINIFALLSYNSEVLERMGGKQGLSMSVMREKTENYTSNMACDEKIGMKSFVALGGKLVYHYRFSDGTEYITVVVDSCE